MKNNLLELNNVWKIYRIGNINVNAIKDVNLIIKKGEFIAISGSSGSGKSTMMHLIGCLDVPSEGTVFIEGKDITSLDKSQLSQIRGKKVGFIFQQFNLIPTLTALENVMLPMEFQEKSDGDKLKEKAIRLLELVGLKERINHKPTELSGGQKQRVAIARALANDPEIILADEPTGNLDSKTGKYIMDFLRDLHKKQNKTIIIVTHDLRLVKFAERIVELKDGEIIKK